MLQQKQRFCDATFYLPSSNEYHLSSFPKKYLYLCIFFTCFTSDIIGEQS